MTIFDQPSPNHSERRPGVCVDTVLLHHTASAGNVAPVVWMLNPKAGVSAHYVILTDGDVLRLVDERRKAWHAGLGRLPWETCAPYDFNHRSIGIEMVNPGDGVTPFTGAQYRALGELLPDIVRRLGLKRVSVSSHDPWQPGLWSGKVPDGEGYILGHRDVAQPPGRKTDPADNFDWERVREMLKTRTA